MGPLWPWAPSKIDGLKPLSPALHEGLINQCQLYFQLTTILEGEFSFSFSFLQLTNFAGRFREDVVAVVVIFAAVVFVIVPEAVVVVVIMLLVDSGIDDVVVIVVVFVQFETESPLRAGMPSIGMTRC